MLVRGCPGLQGPGRRCVGDHQAQVPYEKTPGSETGSVNRRARPLAVFSGGRIWGPHGEPLRPRRQRSSASPLNAMRPHTGGRIELCRNGPSIIKNTVRRPAVRLATGRYCFRKSTLLYVSRWPNGRRTSACLSLSGSPPQRSHPPIDRIGEPPCSPASRRSEIYYVLGRTTLAGGVSPSQRSALNVD